MKAVYNTPFQGRPSPDNGDAARESVSNTWSPDTMTKVQRSCLVYAECCCVDYGGIMAAARMNEDDMKAMKAFRDAGIVKRFGRVPYRVLETCKHSVPGTHYVELTDKGWELASACRKYRAQQRGPYATAAFAAVDEKERLEEGVAAEVSEVSDGAEAKKSATKKSAKKAKAPLR